tara:strand:- start:1227 stop:2615 length:1389 start_codon:yes stop_codon:yes gene_type:complete
MGADRELIRGARDAYKDRSAAGMKTAGEGLDKITSSINQWAIAKKQEDDAEQKLRDEAQAEITKTATDMADNFKSLGQEEFNVWKEDVRGLREEMNAALGPPRDEDAVMDINLRLSELKSKGMKAKDDYEAIHDGWQGENGEPVWDVNAMTDEGLEAHRNFMNNPTRKFIRTEDGKDAYTWEEPNPDYLNDIATPNVPKYKGSVTYTLNELNDFTVLPQTENAGLLMDYTLEKQELYSSTGGEGNVKVQDVRKKVQEIIPKDPKGLRSWAKSNPTGDHKLDVREYLIDNISRIGSYKELGVTEKQKPGEPGYGVIDENDIVSDADRTAFFDAIMNADNPEITHGILSEMMTNITYNKITNQEDKNEDYNPESNMMMDGSMGKTEEDITAEVDSVQQNQLNELKIGPKGGETKEEMAERLGMGLKDARWDKDTEQFISIESLYATAAKKKKKKAKGGADDLGL